jgi:hypothetical protein
VPTISRKPAEPTISKKKPAAFVFDSDVHERVPMSLKSMHMKAVHQRQMVEAGFLAACTAKARKVMNDRITGIMALNFSAEEKALYHRDSAAEKEALERQLQETNPHTDGEQRAG